MIAATKIVENYNCYDKYEQMTDEELIEEVKYGNGDAEKYFYTKYQRIIKKLSGSFFIIGAEKDDVFQEAMIGLFKAVKEYKPNSEVPFRYYSEICMKRQIISAIRKSKRNKNYLLYNTNSIYTGTDDEEWCILDRIECSNVLNPENVVMLKEKMNILREIMENILSDFEKLVWMYYINGKTYQEIADLLIKDVKSIDNAIQRIRKKILKYKEKIDN